jgi:putative sugar O-methyltransferase
MNLDSPKLLDLMLADLAKAPPVFQPTNYWRRYCQQIVKELRKDGLHDFRRRRGTYMASMGATDPGPTHRVLLDNRRFNNMRTQRIPGALRILKTLDSLLTDVLGDRVLHATMLYGMTARDVERRAIEKADACARRGKARPLAAFEASLVGSPEYVFSVEGKPITMTLIDYYLRYAYCSRFIDFEDLRVFVELGSGSGRQAEIIAKLHPRIAYFCFDLPPQLYVAEQYLKAVFGRRVVSYEDCRNMSVAPDPEPGKIYMLGNWQFPIIERLKLDLFWNAASFQEMEPDVVQNYLKTVDRTCQYVFLLEAMAGVHLKAAGNGEAGVLEKTKYEHYERFLPSFRNVHMEPAEYGATTSPAYSDSFWVRRENGAPPAAR